jgi:hypothetical protein
MADIRAFTKNMFILSEQWQDIPDDAILPAGMQIEVDMTTGRKRARIPPQDAQHSLDEEYEKGRSRGET